MDKGAYKMEDVDLSDLGLYLSQKETTTSTNHEQVFYFSSVYIHFCLACILLLNSLF